MKLKAPHKGFTLLEMVIALGIFMLFMGAVLNSFISLTTAQQKANLSREGVAEAKEILNQISIEGREKRIDYFCNQGISETADEENTTEQANAFSLNCQIDENTKLVLVSNDGLERILIASQNINQDSTYQQISAKKETRPNTLSNWSTAETTNLHSERLKVRSFEVKITPTTDPYELSSSNLIHPITQLSLVVERNSQKPDQESQPIVIQTTISSRAYNPQVL